MQEPFAAVLGCADARVPVEIVFGQGFNDLFVVRVAGNVLGDECLGSLDFAVSNLAAGLKADAGFWRDNLPKLRQRFDAWQGH